MRMPNSEIIDNSLIECGTYTGFKPQQGKTMENTNSGKLREFWQKILRTIRNDESPEESKRCFTRIIYDDATGRKRPLNKNKNSSWKETIVDIENLIQDAQKAWFEYGEVIKEKFDFPKDSQIVAGPLFNVIRTRDEERIQSFISWVKEQSQNMKNMRGLNE